MVHTRYRQDERTKMADKKWLGLENDWDSVNIGRVCGTGSSLSMNGQWGATITVVTKRKMDGGVKRFVVGV